MSILIISPDAAAGRSLTAALGRRDRQSVWIAGPDAVDWATNNDPLVVVVDRAEPHFRELIRDVSAHAPWIRVYELSDSSESRGTAVFEKPFDAAEVAGILAIELELAELDRKRRALELELEHEKRLAAIGRTAATMAHEISSPLAVIRAVNASVAELAASTGDTPMLEAVEDVRLAVDRIEGFVNHVCGFARRSRHVHHEASVLETVRMALRLAKPHAEEQRVQVTFEARDDVWLPHDTARISQAVLNVVANAVDAAAEGFGHLTVRVSSEASAVRIQVDDDGPGVSEEIRERLFEPFATTKPQGKGTGLGLAIARQIVDDHGGAVTLSPRVGSPGTRAEIVLPLVTRSSASPKTERAPR